MDADLELLKAENEVLRARVAELERTVERQHATIERLTAALDETRRAGKRQAAAFRKADGPKPEPKKPGRKPGDAHGPRAHRAPPPPNAIDETHEAPLPCACPNCGGRRFDDQRVVVQYQTEIPRRPIQRKFNIHVARCRGCGGAVPGRHELQTSDATCYEVDPTRSHEPAERLLGLDWSGTMTRDGWAVYDRFKCATHQQCTAHLLRRCNELLETATGMAARFPRQVKDILQHGLRLRDRHAAGEMTAHGWCVMGGRLRSQMESLVAPIKRHAGNERFAKFLEAHLDELFAYLRRPEIDATNWRGEHAIRPAVVNRKVWGGNRTWRGAAAQSTVTSVLRTLAQRGHAALAWLATALRRPTPLLIPP